MQWDKFDESSGNLSSSSEEFSLPQKRTKAGSAPNKFLKKKKATSSADSKHDASSDPKKMSKAEPPKPAVRKTGWFMT